MGSEDKQLICMCEKESKRSKSSLWLVYDRLLKGVNSVLWPPGL